MRRFERQEIRPMRYELFVGGRGKFIYIKGGSKNLTKWVHSIGG